MDHLISARLQRDGGDAAVPHVPLRFAPDVHAAIIDADAVLLDVRQNSYHCLAGGAALCRRLEVGAPVEMNAPIRSLLDAGLIAGTASSRREPPILPTRTIIHDRLPVNVATDLLAGVSAVARVRAARRHGGLSHYLDTQPATPTRSEPEAVSAAGRRFWSLLPYLPIEGECLVRSALLVHFLHALGLKADWVFGVRLNPFIAHCWVQVGDTCLNDDVERLVAYTPIMVR